MDALDILRQMHVDAKQAFRDIEQASPDNRGGLWAKLRPELVAHEQIEERIIYQPAAKDLGSQDPTMVDWELEHKQLVHHASSLMDQIGRLDAADPRFLNLIGELHQALDQHIQLEETSAWPRIRQSWGEDKLQRAVGKVQAAQAMAVGSASATGFMGSETEQAKDAGDWATGG